MNYSEIRSGVRRRRKRPGNLIVGMVFLIIGSLLFAREFGADLPWWLFKWEVIVITVGIIIGLKSGFRDFGWIVISGVGFFFLSDDIFPGWNASRFIAPVAVLAVGAFIILNRISPSNRDTFSPADDPAGDGSLSPGTATRDGEPGVAREPGGNIHNDMFKGSRAGEAFTGDNAAPGRPVQPSDAGMSEPSQTFDHGFTRRQNEPSGSRRDDDQNQNQQPTGGFGNRAQMEEEQLDIVSVFSAVNRKVFSKNFVGGEIVCVFGGSEVNFMNADISAGTVELEVVCIFGGATLFIPPNWHVRSEMGSVFGGVDDKRKNPVPDYSRTLIIKGVCIFGGLEIKTKY